MNRSLSDNQYIVISYDITDDRRRNRVCQELKNYGERIQFSVFELLIDTDTLKKLAKRLEGLIDRTEDSVRIYVLCNACCQRIAILGTGKLSEDEDVYVY